MRRTRQSRRDLLAAVGSAAIAALSGCTTGGGNGDATTNATTDAPSTTNAASTTTRPSTASPTETPNAGAESDGGRLSADAAPRDLLPDPPEGWSLVDTRPTEEDPPVEEAGRIGVYADDGGTRYAAAIYRYAEQSTADTLVAEWDENGHPNFDVALATGAFVVAGAHQDGSPDALVELLGRIEGLDADYVGANSVL